MTFKYFRTCWELTVSHNLFNSVVDFSWYSSYIFLVTYQFIFLYFFNSGFEVFHITKKILESSIVMLVIIIYLHLEKMMFSVLLFILNFRLR